MYNFHTFFLLAIYLSGIKNLPVTHENEGREIFVYHFIFCCN
jgi:hypothetical protein